MQYGDLVTIEIRIRNNGEGSGYAKEVISTIADGMEYVEDNEINKANGWKIKGNIVRSNKYSYETDINNELYPKKYDYEQGNEQNSGENNDDNSENGEDVDSSKDTIDTDYQENSGSSGDGNNTESGSEDAIINDVIENSIEGTSKEETEEGTGEGLDENTNTDGAENAGEESEENTGEEMEDQTEDKPAEDVEEEPEDTEINTGVQKLQLVLRVTKDDKTHHRLLLQITVEQQDKRGDVVEYSKEDEANSKNRVEMQYTYTDLQIEKRITQIMTTDKTTNTVKKYDIYQEPGNIVKLELPSKNIGNTKLDIIYEIKVKNVGDYNTEIDQLVDILPTGVNFSKEGNEGWSVGENGHIVYDNFEEYLRPEEEKTVKLKLTYELDEEGMADITNEAYILSTKDLDEVKITEGKEEIEGTNNYGKSELIVSVITGETIAMYIGAILGGMLIVVAGISLIKKYIL